MKLIVITNEDKTLREPQLINRMFDAGMSNLHLRKPNLSIQEYCSFITDIHERYHQRLIICGHFELLKDFNLGGIHLNSHQRILHDLDNVLTLTTHQSLSTSFHSWQEIRENNFPFHYVFISPVFDSISKHGYKAGISLADAGAIKNEFKYSGRYCPDILGLGGVSVNNIEVLYKNGFDGAAVLGAVWQSANPEPAVTELINATAAFPC